MKVFLNKILILIMMHCANALYRYVAKVNVAFDGRVPANVYGINKKPTTFEILAMSIEVRRTSLQEKEECQIETLDLINASSFDDIPTDGYNPIVQRQQVDESGNGKTFSFQLSVAKSNWKKLDEYFWNPETMRFKVERNANKLNVEGMGSYDKSSTDGHLFWQKRAKIAQINAKNVVNDNGENSLYFAFCSKRTLVPVTYFFIKTGCDKRENCKKNVGERLDSMDTDSKYLIVFKEPPKAEVNLQTRQVGQDIELFTEAEKISFDYATEKPQKLENPSSQSNKVKFVTGTFPNKEFTSAKFLMSPFIDSIIMCTTASQPVKSNSRESFDCPLNRKIEAEKKDPNPDSAYFAPYYVVNSDQLEFKPLEDGSLSTEALQTELSSVLSSKQSSNLDIIPFVKDGNIWLEFSKSVDFLGYRQLKTKSDDETSNLSFTEKIDENKKDLVDRYEELLQNLETFFAHCKEFEQDLMEKRFNLPRSFKTMYEELARFRVYSAFGNTVSKFLKEELVFGVSKDGSEIGKKDSELSALVNSFESMLGGKTGSLQSSDCGSKLTELKNEIFRQNNGLGLFQKLEILKKYFESDNLQNEFERQGTAYNPRPKDELDLMTNELTKDDKLALETNPRKKAESNTPLDEVLKSKFPSLESAHRTIESLKNFENKCILDESATGQTKWNPSSIASIKELISDAIKLYSDLVGLNDFSGIDYQSGSLKKFKGTVNFLKTVAPLIKDFDELHETQIKLFKELRAITSETCELYNLQCDSLLDKLPIFSDNDASVYFVYANIKSLQQPDAEFKFEVEDPNLGLKADLADLGGYLKDVLD